MPLVSDQYKFVTVCDSTLTILDDRIEDTICTDRTTKALRFQERSATNGDTLHTTELSQTLLNKTDSNYNDQSVVDKVIREVTENGDSEYVGRWYRYSSQGDTVDPS